MFSQSLVSRIAVAATLLVAGAAHAQVTVQDAWVRATVPQQKATGAFMRLTAAQDARLVSASSPVAGVTEVHEMKLVDNVMKMRPLPALDLPAGQAVELKPGGYHIMLLDLKQPVAQGSTVPLTLVFEAKDGQRTTQELQAPVRAVSATAAPAMGHGKPHGGH
ncbi:MAG: copper chaperone PCu(A)C [Acidovorax sp.]|uniref:copper chaperone PCu(A)C n=1 Tax=Diaphorobacter sp. JS3050 TaxID=2735554 RepID=UPI0015577846|nr:copper chaperone PCu(A)C [Diaphorobacter sp. JS3050]MDU7586850.1 copper chaperone PCu(A)C [Acidovorax sp.]QJY34113.1 copper chaperone PCu(A)C [Diaphorobacter sp. JS3050]